MQAMTDQSRLIVFCSEGFFFLVVVGIFVFVACMGTVTNHHQILHFKPYKLSSTFTFSGWKDVNVFSRSKRKKRECYNYYMKEKNVNESASTLLKCSLHMAAA